MDYSIFELGHVHCSKWGYHSKDKRRMANRVDPHETAHSSRLIWIFTVCKGMFWSAGSKELNVFGQVLRKVKHEILFLVAMT